MTNKIDETLSVIDELINLKTQEGAETAPLDESSKQKEPLAARIISIILHPIFITTYSVCLLFIYTDLGFVFEGQFLRFIAPVFFLSCIAPASSIYFLKRSGLINDYGLKNKNERFIPFFAAILADGLLLHYFFAAKLYIWFLAVLAALIILLLIAMAITPYWKISIHMMGIGGLIGSILSVCYNIKGLNPFILFIILFILAGCLGVSRLMLNRHTQAQVYTGFLIGFAVSYLCVWIGAHWGLLIL